MNPRILAAALTVSVSALVTAAAPPPGYRDVAVDAAKWIRSGRMQTTFGVTWAADPRDPKTISTALYSGSPGVVLFLLELSQATGDRAYLDEAKRGSDELMTKIPSETGMGLYEGVA